MKLFKKLVFPVAAAVCVVLFMILGYVYVSKMQLSLWNQLVVNITEVTSQGGHAFGTYVKKEKETVSRLAKNVSQLSSEDRDEMTYILGQYGMGVGIFSLVIFDDEGGGELYLANSDDVISLNAAEVDERFSSYGESGVTELYINDFTGQQTLGYYQRFTFTDGKKGLVRKGQITSILRDEFSLSFYNDTGFFYVVGTDGDIFVRSTHNNSNRTFSNVFDVIKHNGNSEADVKTFQENMSDKKQGAMRFKFDGSDYIFAFAPIEETDGWYLVSAIPNSSVIQHTQNILKTSQSFVIIFAAAIVIFALFVFVTYFYRKRVHAKETEVKYREQLFGLLANNTDDVFLMLSSEDLAVEYVSPNVERVLGVAATEVKESVTALKNTDYEDVGSVDETALKNLPADGSVTYECEREHKKTGARKFFLETVYRTSVGASEKFIVVLSDRTKERQTEYAIKEALESAQAANKAKSVFLSNMSHDIRTPMNAIIGFTELLKRDAADADKVMQHTRKISSSGQHLLGLINDILDMSKIENGKTVLNVCEFSLPELVDELDDIMRPQAKAKKQSFDIVVHGIKEEKLLGDKLRINQILMNILSNAVKYTPEGGKVLMEIRGLPRVNANFARLCFTVKDNGIGMSAEFLENIFKPFTREVSSTVNQIQGTGLGMSIAKNLVELMGGTISVESKQGKGSTFRIELELRISDGAAEHDFFRDHKICKALVIDDDADCCEGVVETLDGIGVETQSALSGAQAIDIVKTAHECGKDYDLILVDMKMPGMDGIETTKAIRKIVPKEASVMLLTAYDWSGVEQKAEKAGIDAFLPKPFFLSNLKQTIRNINVKKGGNVQEAENAQSLEGRRFLVAEDNELNSEILCELLDMKGVTCEVACDGKIALEMFKKSEENYYDAVLMDIQMPVMNGYEATKAIRASSHPRANTIPIIAMTANAFAEDINNALSSGMDAHVAKPVDMNRLEKVLTEHLYKSGDKK